jgi:lysozyme
MQLDKTFNSYNELKKKEKTASSKCISIIKQFEGFSDKPYLCPAGVWTVGYGSTRYADGTRVSPSDKSITENEAASIMYATLQTYIDAVNRYVSTSINQNQFDALVSFAYNLGTKALLNSTLLRMINEGNFLGASQEFSKWVHADGKVLAGLVARREQERILFGSMV